MGSLQRMKIYVTFALLILALSGEISSCKPSPEDENGLPTIEPDSTTTTEMVPDGSTIQPSSVEPNSTEVTTPEITTVASTSTIYENTSTDTEITDTSESTITTEATPTTISDPCLLPKEIGFCEPSDSGQPITRFFFDNEQSKKCQAFTFMGCGANENNFITKHECQAVCQSSIDDNDQELGNVIFNPVQNEVIVTKVNFENGFPVNWTMKDMDVVEIDKDVGHVLIPSILNGVPQLGQFSTHFDIADKGTFQLDLKLKIQHFNSSMSLEDNPYLQILLLRNISLETSTSVQAESSTALAITTVAEKEDATAEKIFSEETNDELIEVSENSYTSLSRSDSKDFWHLDNAAMESHNIFSSNDYSLYFSKIVEDSKWIHVRFQLKDDLDEGHYELRFMAKRGQQENQIVAIDDIQLKTILITKTDEEMPTTTTTTTTTTETMESTTIGDLPTGSSSGP